MSLKHPSLALRRDLSPSETSRTMTKRVRYSVIVPFAMSAFSASMACGSRPACMSDLDQVEPGSNRAAAYEQLNHRHQFLEAPNSRGAR